jgi:hypothetical protein
VFLKPRHRHQGESHRMLSLVGQSSAIISSHENYWQDENHFRFTRTLVPDQTWFAERLQIDR